MGAGIAPHSGLSGDIAVHFVESHGAHGTGRMGPPVAWRVHHRDAHDRRLEPAVDGGQAAVLVGDQARYRFVQVLNEQLQSLDVVYRLQVLIPCRGRAHCRHRDQDRFVAQLI